MTLDGPDWSRNRRSTSGLSRRRLLAALSGIGAVGAASGAGTFAHFSDTAPFAGNEMGAGEVDIDISCGPERNCAVEGGHVTFAVDRIVRGHGGYQTFTVDVQTNPARLWLGTDCPPAFDPLGDAIEASLKMSDGHTWFTLSSGSLAGIRRDLVAGRRLDDLDGDGCLDPEGEPLEIVLDWSLPGDAPDSATGKSTSFGFQLYTEQCRHVSENDAAGSNPFVGTGPCDEPPECAGCEDGDRFARLTFEYLGSDDTNITARSRGAGQVGVAFEGPISSGDTFTAEGAVVGDDGELGTNLYLDDGSGDPLGRPQGNGNGEDIGRPPGLKVHTSCSEDLYVGQLFGPSDSPRYRLVAGDIAGKGPICEQSADDGPAEDY